MAGTVTNTASRGLMAYMQWADNQSLSAVAEAANAVKLESQKRVPVKTGELKRSCRLVVTGTRLSRKASISYHTPYALYIHEDMNIRHPDHGSYNCGGDAKFLTGPLFAMASQVLNTMAKRMTK